MLDDGRQLTTPSPCPLADALHAYVRRGIALRAAYVDGMLNGPFPDKLDRGREKGARMTKLSRRYGDTTTATRMGDRH